MKKIDKEGIPKRLWYILKSIGISILVVLTMLVDSIRILLIPVCLTIGAICLGIVGVVTAMIITLICGILEFMWCPIYYILYGRNWFMDVDYYTIDGSFAISIYETIVWYVHPLNLADLVIKLNKVTRSKLNYLREKVMNMYPEF